MIEQSKLDLLTSGIPTDRLAAKSQLPVQVVEAELKSYAKNTPGLVAKRLDGQIVRFREGTATPAASAAAAGRSCHAFDRSCQSPVRPQGRERKEDRVSHRAPHRPQSSARPCL